VADPLSLRGHVEGRLSGLKNDRYSFWVHWQEIATFILPRRYRWLITPNQWNKGSPINGAIIDSTGTIAARTLASGLMSGITSPTRPWFKLTIEGMGTDITDPANRWLAEVERRMYRVFHESNFYTAMAVLYQDIPVFGTAPLIINEDFENVVDFDNPCAGEYYVANNDKNYVDVFYREFVKTVAATVQWFGIDNVSEATKRLYQMGGPALSQELMICQAVEPNNPPRGKTPKEFPFRSVYWERGSGEEDGFLQERGYHEFPAPTGRWDLVANDAYGRCPAMDALGDIKQLQQETKRKAQAIDKMVNPPMIADVQLKNQPASLLPGGVTYVTGQNNVGFKPVYEVQPRIAEMQQDIAEIQNRIRSVFFNDLFMMISQLQTVRTATEIDARREEKLIMLGPVLERFQNELLDPVIDRVFAIMNRAKLLPPPPVNISGQFIKVEYISMLAEAQKAVSTGAIERILQVVGNVAAANPEISDNIDYDAGIREYGTLLAANPKLFRTPDQVQQIRMERQKQNQQTALAAATPGMAKAGKTLSEIDVGGGKNALQSILGNESVAA
jgi:hypothetical protein